MAVVAVLWAAASYVLPWRPNLEQLGDAGFYAAWGLGWRKKADSLTRLDQCRRSIESKEKAGRTARSPALLAVESS